MALEALDGVVRFHTQLKKHPKQEAFRGNLKEIMENILPYLRGAIKITVL
jgi:hypothetical protein